MTVRFELRASRVGGLLDGLLTRLLDPMSQPGVTDEVTKEMRASIRQEFAGGLWKSPAGSRVKWKPTHPFGDRQPGPLLGGTDGGLFAAWNGGAGGFSKSTSSSVTIGVDRVDAAVHRGGSGTAVSPRKVTRIRPKKSGSNGKPALFWKLGFGQGAWLSKKTLRDGLKVPARPHATRNPDLERSLVDVLLRRVFTL